MTRIVVDAATLARLDEAFIGRTHARAMLAELDPALRVQARQVRYVARPAGRHVAVGAW